jgi:hypothetical protein
MHIDQAHSRHKKKLARVRGFYRLVAQDPGLFSIIFPSDMVDALSKDQFAC